MAATVLAGATALATCFETLTALAGAAAGLMLATCSCFLGAGAYLDLAGTADCLAAVLLSKRFSRSSVLLGGGGV